jgi:hypothetical protein
MRKSIKTSNLMLTQREYVILPTQKSDNVGDAMFLVRVEGSKSSWVDRIGNPALTWARCMRNICVDLSYSIGARKIHRALTKAAASAKGRRIALAQSFGPRSLERSMSSPSSFYRLHYWECIDRDEKPLCRLYICSHSQMKSYRRQLGTLDRQKSWDMHKWNEKEEG